MFCLACQGLGLACQGLGLGLEPLSLGLGLGLVCQGLGLGLGLELLSLESKPAFWWMKQVLKLFLLAVSTV